MHWRVLPSPWTIPMPNLASAPSSASSSVTICPVPSKATAAGAVPVLDGLEPAHHGLQRHRPGDRLQLAARRCAAAARSHGRGCQRRQRLPALGAGHAQVHRVVGGGRQVHRLAVLEVHVQPAAGRAEAADRGGGTVGRQPLPAPCPGRAAPAAAAARGSAGRHARAAGARRRSGAGRLKASPRHARGGRGLEEQAALQQLARQQQHQRERRRQRMAARWIRPVDQQQPRDQQPARGSADEAADRDRARSPHHQQRHALAGGVLPLRAGGAAPRPRRAASPSWPAPAPATAGGSHPLRPPTADTAADPTSTTATVAASPSTAVVPKNLIPVGTPAQCARRVAAYTITEQNTLAKPGPPPRPPTAARAPPAPAPPGRDAAAGTRDSRVQARPRRRTGRRPGPRGSARRCAAPATPGRRTAAAPGATRSRPAPGTPAPGPARRGPGPRPRRRKVEQPVHDRGGGEGAHRQLGQHQHDHQRRMRVLGADAGRSRRAAGWAAPRRALL